MKSHKKIVEDAIDLVTPSINKLLERTNRPVLHIVVMDPRLKPWESDFEQAILHEKSFGDLNKWDIPFAQMARKKAHQAWRSNQPNLVNQTLHTSSLREGDLLFYGSFVHGDIVVACSGVEQWYDMLISGWIAIAIEQLCMSEYQNNKLNNPTQSIR